MESTLFQQYFAIPLQVRLCNRYIEAVDFEAHTRAEFIRNLRWATRQLPEAQAGPQGWQVHLFYGEEWWDLSANLPAFCRWMLERGRSSFDEIDGFMQVPVSRPEWLYEAAEQMSRLLRAADLILTQNQSAQA